MLKEDLRAMRAARGYAYNLKLQEKVEERLARARASLESYLLLQDASSAQLGAFRVDLNDGELSVTQTAADEGWEQLPIEDVLAELSPDCEIGKAAAMENKAKSLGYARRFAAARKVNEKLVKFQPGNQEALFDKAQAECALGLPDEEAKTYARLLEIAPLHTLASKALSRVDVRAEPEVRAGYSYWDEDGKKGRLSQITRQRFDAELLAASKGALIRLAHPASLH